MKEMMNVEESGFLGKLLLLSSLWFLLILHLFSLLPLPCMASP